MKFGKAVGARRGSVLLLRGCVGSVVSGGVNDACMKVLTANGFDVQTLDSEACCGAMAAHANDPQGAKDYAIRMVELLEMRREEAFISPIAGCGAQLKSLHEVLAGTEYAARAEAVVRKVRDITEFLAEADLPKPPGRIDRIVTYHDPCHLTNVQKIAEAPRRLLAMIEGLELVPLAENDICCGAAGAYNLSQPEMAEKIGRRKVENILRTKATEVVTANVGCQMQMERELKRAGHAEIKVRHVVELLAEAYE